MIASPDAILSYRAVSMITRAIAASPRLSGRKLKAHIV
jgi:hypothetical protein